MISTILTQYRADASDHIAELKKLKGAEAERAKETIAAHKKVKNSLDDQMKSIGFVTRVMREQGTGRELAAVYVPTTPNPTSGYLEIVPVEKMTPTDWTVDQAMSFIISGGAVAPDFIPFSVPKSVPQNAPAAETTTP